MAVILVCVERTEDIRRTQKKNPSQGGNKIALPAAFIVKPNALPSCFGITWNQLKYMHL